MKKYLTSLMIIFSLIVSSCPMSFAVDINFPVESDHQRNFAGELYLRYG